MYTHSLIIHTLTHTLTLTHSTHRPEQHGEEMLSLISGVLSKSHDPILVAMATEGLVSLCRAEVGSKQFFPL